MRLDFYSRAEGLSVVLASPSQQNFLSALIAETLRRKGFAFATEFQPTIPGPPRRNLMLRRATFNNHGDRLAAI